MEERGQRREGRGKVKDGRGESKKGKESGSRRQIIQPPVVLWLP